MSIMDHRPDSTQKRALLFAAIPYAAVFVGVHLAKSGTLAVLSYHLGICAALTATGRWGLLREIRQGFSLVPALACCAACALAGPAVYLLWPVAAREGLVLSTEIAVLGLLAKPWPLLVAYSLMVNPVLEEVYWRGFLGSPSRGPALVDLLFAGYHALVLGLFLEWPFALAGTLCLGATSWLWRSLRNRHGGLAIPVLGHLFADAGVIAAVVMLV